MNYIYPAVFAQNSDDSYTVTFPDLIGCISEGKTLDGALQMAQSALTQWLNYLKDENEKIPKASNIRDVKLGDNEFTSLISADVRDARAVKRTVSLPRWMDEEATNAGLSLSKVLQDALSQRV